MAIFVHLHTIYQKQTEKGLVNQIKLAYQVGQTIKELRDFLELEINEESTLFVVNGKMEDLDYLIKDGDAIHFIPAISGG